VNSQNKVIGRQEFKAGGYWNYDTYRRPSVSLGYLNANGWGNKDDGRCDVRFANVKADDITDNLTIRFASVNGEDAVTAAQKGVLQIKSMPKSEFDYDDQFAFAYGEIKKYKGTNKDIVIPNTIWDNPVISIGESAFSSKSLTDVTIPDGVTYIGRQAFAYNDFTRITIGENVTLGENAFCCGFDNAYKNNGRPARQFRRASDNSDNARKFRRASDNSDNWVAQMTQEEQEELRQRQEAERQRWEAERPQREREEMERQRQQEREKVERQRHEAERQRWEATAKLETYRNATGLDYNVSGGVSLMMNSLDSCYRYNGAQFHFSVGWLMNRFNFVHAGFTLDWGAIGFNDDTATWDKIKAAHPGINDEINIKDADFGNSNFSSGFFNLGAFVKLYPADIMYLLGGVGLGWRYADASKQDISLISVVEPVFSVGTGFHLLHGSHTNYEGGGGVLLETQYKMVPLKGRLVGYLSINLGIGTCRAGVGYVGDKSRGI
jgi:hypothetical protein